MKKFFVSFIFFVSSILFFVYLNSQKVKADSTTYNDNYGVSHYTRYDMENMLNSLNKSNVRLPNFDANKIQNINSAKDSFYPEYKGRQLSIGDNWVVKDRFGNVANFHGYHLVIGMTFNDMTDPKSLNGKLYLFYQKIIQQDKGASSWKCAGPVFRSSLEGVTNNKSIFQSSTGQWSGSAFIQKNGSLRLFYTVFDEKYLNTPTDDQYLATALLQPIIKNNSLTLNHKKTSDRRIIFKADGKYYQTPKQMSEEPNASSSNEFTLRDPQIIFNKGKQYLTFEANTGTKFGGEGDNTIFNQANIGGDNAFRQNEVNYLNSKPNLKNQANYNNAAIGMLELTSNYKVKRLMKPLVVFNGVEEETERPSLIQYKNKFYLFTAMHGWHMASDKVNATDAFVLGFVSNKLDGSYKPLNNNGLVLYSNAPSGGRTTTYSYGVVQGPKNPFIITSYMGTVLPNNDNNHGTLAPSLLLDINNNKTNIRKTVLSQGQVAR